MHQITLEDVQQCVLSSCERWKEGGSLTQVKWIMKMSPSMATDEWSWLDDKKIELCWWNWYLLCTNADIDCLLWSVLHVSLNTGLKYKPLLVAIWNALAFVEAFTKHINHCDNIFTYLRSLKLLSYSHQPHWGPRQRYYRPRWWNQTHSMGLQSNPVWRHKICHKIEHIFLFTVSYWGNMSTFALNAMSLTIISPVNRTVKMRLRVSESLVIWSDWLQC